MRAKPAPKERAGLVYSGERGARGRNEFLRRRKRAALLLRACGDDFGGASERGESGREIVARPAFDGFKSDRLQIAREPHGLIVGLRRDELPIGVGGPRVARESPALDDLAGLPAVGS